MIFLRDILEETKKLRIFDFDDTLVTTHSFIHVTQKNGKKIKLTPGQYAVYEKKPGDQFDYSDFDKVHKPEEIVGYTKLLKRFLSSEGERRVTILTARGAYKPIKDYLKDIGAGSVYVVALGDSDPQKKAKYIEDQIKKGYDDVFFMDDSPKNIAAVQQLERKYPDVKFRIQLAKLR
jgi:FMN phosphatase YigB (HAD superfamily)